ELAIKMNLGITLSNHKKLLVEIKSVQHLEKVHHKTVLSYLKLSGNKLVILVNFNVNLIKEEIHRKIIGELL
ncbi:MAG: GxxExxY protein, partial [Bacteroidales bacterium]